jgi:hypothetical protein
VGLLEDELVALGVRVHDYLPCSWGCCLVVFFQLVVPVLVAGLCVQDPRIEMLQTDLLCDYARELRRSSAVHMMNYYRHMHTKIMPDWDNRIDPSSPPPSG